MGWVQEIIDLFGKLSFFTIVHEYEQGLYFRGGKAVSKRIKLSGKELEDIVREENEIIRENGGCLRTIFHHLLQINSKKTEYPDEFKKRCITGLPLHKKRVQKNKVLRPGVYFNIPIIDSIVVRSQQMRVLNLGNIVVPTDEEDTKEVYVSCNLRYELMDLYRAYTAVHDYDRSLADYTLSILAKCSRGKKYNEWKDSQMMEKLEEDIKKELRKIVTENWGLKIHDVIITHNVKCNVNYVNYEGVPAPMNESSLLNGGVLKGTGD